MASTRRKPGRGSARRSRAPGRGSRIGATRPRRSGRAAPIFGQLGCGCRVKGACRRGWTKRTRMVALARQSGWPPEGHGSAGNDSAAGLPEGSQCDPGSEAAADSFGGAAGCKPDVARRNRGLAAATVRYGGRRRRFLQQQAMAGGVLKAGWPGRGGRRRVLAAGNAVVSRPGRRRDGSLDFRAVLHFLLQGLRTVRSGTTMPPVGRSRLAAAAHDDGRRCPVAAGQCDRSTTSSPRLQRS